MSIERARTSVRYSLERLRLHVYELRALQYPGDHPGPRKWLNLIAGLLDTAEKYLLESADRQVSPDAGLDLARDASALCASAYACLNVMRGSSIEDIAYPVVPGLQTWFTNLGIQNDTFFRAELVANYELKTFIEDEFKSLRGKSDSLQKAIDDINWPIYRVTVPSGAYAILPHLSIVAHELGHALYKNINWDLTDFNTHELGNLRTRIATRIGTTLPLDPQVENALKQTFSNWFEELAADAFAFFLTGPAIFFALSDFSQLLGGGYGISHSHPTHTLRRKILFDELNKDDGASFAAIFRSYTGLNLTEDFNSVLLLPAPDTDTVYNALIRDVNGYNPRFCAVMAELHDSMQRVEQVVYDGVRTYMRDHAPEAIYTPQKYRNDLKEHFHAMLAAIPPVERGQDLGQKESVDLSSILNIGWTTLLAKLGELRVRTESDSFDELKLERLNGLLLKALELSYAKRQWDSTT